MGLLDANAATWLPIDSMTGYRETIDVAHAKMHDGRHFTNSYALQIATAGAMTVSVVAPASAVGFIHLAANVETPFIGTLTLSESPGASAGSDLTALTFNNRRNSTITSPASVSGTISYESAGTVLETHYTSTTMSVVGFGGLPIRYEYVLKPSTRYLLRWLNTGGVTSSTIINTSFYY